MTTLDAVAELARTVAPVYLRYSAGPQADAQAESRDHESGCRLPGLSVNPLRPEPWWDRPDRHWVARQLTQYMHLAEPGRFAWILTGRIVGRGPDCEPLVDQVTALAVIADEVLAEAREVYEREFRVGAAGVASDDDSRSNHGR